MKGLLKFYCVSLIVVAIGTLFFAFTEKIEADEISINCQLYSGKSFNYECTGTPPKACIANPIAKQGYTGMGSCITKCQASGGDVARFKTTAQWQWDWYCCNADNSGTCTINKTDDTSITKVLNPISDLLNPPLCDPPEKKPHTECKENTYQSIDSCGIDIGEIGKPCQEGTPGQGAPTVPPSEEMPKGKLEVDWPASPTGTKLTGESFTNLIQYLYEWGISLGGFLAFISLIIAGFQYLTSAGNSMKMKDAIDRMKSAGWGLVLLLGSFIILNTINPQLTDLTMPEPEQLIKSGWDFDIEDQTLSNPKNKPEPCKYAILYSDTYFSGTSKQVSIGEKSNVPVKSIKILGGCSVTLYDFPVCEQNAFGPYFSKGTTQETKYEIIEASGVSSFGCVKVSQM